MPEAPHPIPVTISTWTIVKVILVILLFLFLFEIRHILAVLFISLVISSAVNPWVDWLQKKKIPRGASILAIYLVVFAFLTLAVSLLIGPITDQVQRLAETYPVLSDKVRSGVDFLKSWNTQGEAIKGLINSQGAGSNLLTTASGLMSKAVSFVSGIVTFFLVLVITFYMAVEENAMKKLVWSLAPEKHQIYIMQLLNQMQLKMGLWLRGQLILSFIIFGLIFTALSIVDQVTGQMPYALVLALLAGLTEFVPYLGPLFAAIPAVFLAFTVSPFLAVLVALVYYIIQLMENNIIVPKLMQKVVGLNPIVSIVMLLVGFRIGGVVGAILGIPVATALTVLVKELFEKNSGEKAV